jgi:hypothetical protein
MAMAAVRAGNVVIASQRLTNTHSNRFLPDIEMSKARHFGAEIKLVDLLFEKPDPQHLAVEMNRFVAAQCGSRGFRYRLLF